ncbi:MAG TPA: DUF4388 domain-containing protein [Thermoanaerobaculia bacterium]|nr:DUF4388 domain-containing protein [Thermoanaerobaculia bacterium]
MIPTAKQLEEIAALREGSLPAVPFAPLLLAHAQQRHTLVLEVRRRQVWKRILLENGVPVDCRSNLAHETLGRYMVLEGRLSEEEFQAALSKSATRGVPMGEVLLEGEQVTAVDLFRLLQQNLAKKLLDLFTWNEGEFRRLEEPPGAGSSLKVKVPQLILTGVTKFAPQEEVDMAVGPLVATRLALNPRPPFPLEELRLHPRQAQLAEALRPGRRMGELAEATGLPVDEITRLLYALSILGVVVAADSVPKELLGSAPPLRPAAATGAIPLPSLETLSKAEKPPAPAPAATAAPAPEVRAVATVPPLELERRRNEIMQAYLSYRRQDAFDLLGVPEEATAEAIDERFVGYCRRFAPWTLDHPELAAMAERARDLFLAGARAYGELADREQRSTLLFRRKTLREERAKKPAASFAIKTDLLDSEAQYKRGKALLEAGKPREALVQLEFAADCDPQNGVYAAEAAWCRYLISSAQASRSLRELAEALRRDPNCGLAAFYAGEIHRQLGAPDEAEPYLRRAIKLMSPDRRPIDALKALSVERKR